MSTPQLRTLSLLVLSLVVTLLAGCGARDADSDRIVPSDAGSGSDILSGTSEDDGRLRIEDLRDPDSALRPASGTLVELRRVVVTAVDTFQEVDDDRRRTGDFWVQERNGGEFSGIQIADDEGHASGLGLMPGMEVTLRGTFDEFFGLDRIQLESIEQTGSVPLPSPVVAEPADIATGGLLARNLQSVLVEVRDVAVPQGSDNRFGRFQVSDGLYIGNNLYRLPQYPPADGTRFDRIRGVVYFSFDENSLLPRERADFRFEGESSALPTSDEREPGAGYRAPELRDPTSSLRPAEGTALRVENLVVTAIDTFQEVDDDRRRTGDVWVQDADGGAWSGLMLYNENNLLDVSDLEPGDRVAVEGAFQTFFGLDRIRVERIDVEGSGAPPEALLVEVSDIATDGPLTQSLQSVLVRVEDVQVAEDGDTRFGRFELDGGLFVGGNLFRLPNYPPAANTRFENLAGVLFLTFDEYVLLPRDAADFDSPGGEPGNGETTEDPTSLRVADLRDPASELAPELGTSITLGSVVVTAIDRHQQPSTENRNRINQFWVADPEGGPFSAIYVFNSYRSASSSWVVDVDDLEVGDRISITGTFAEFPAGSGRQQLQVASFEKLGSASVPGPVSVSVEELGQNEDAVLAALEGSLVTLTNPRLASGTEDARFADFGELLLEEGGLLVDELTPLTDLASGDGWEEVTGILILFQNTSGSVRNYRVAPRSADDLGTFIPAGTDPDPTDPDPTDPDPTDPDPTDPDPTDPDPTDPDPTDPDPTDPPPSIAELRNPSSDQRASFGDELSLEEVVVIAIDTYQQPGTTSGNFVNQFTIQDVGGGEWSALRVFNPGGNALDLSSVESPNGNRPLAVGDVLRISGTFNSPFETSAFGQEQLRVGAESTFVITGTADVPAAVRIDAEQLAANDFSALGPWTNALVEIAPVTLVAPDSRYDDFGDRVGTVGEGAEVLINNEYTALDEGTVPAGGYTAIRGLLFTRPLSGQPLLKLQPTRSSDLEAE